MKPVILYSLPRARSTATLYSCKREIKINEPFRMNLLYKDKSHEEAWAFRAELHMNFVNSGSWDRLVKQMNSDNTVTKIISTQFYHFLPSRKWFEDIVENETHDVFVIERENREETLISNIIAIHFGWAKKEESEPYEFIVNKKLFHHTYNIVDWYLRFYPKKGKIISYENLPESHFDKSLNNVIMDQNSANKYKYIKNIDEVKLNIKHILDYYKDEWDSKIINLDQS